MGGPLPLDTINVGPRSEIHYDRFGACPNVLLNTLFVH
jgi:hypothetical protein